MSNIDKQALIAKIKKQTESFDTVVLKEDEANALLDELEAKDQRIAELSQKADMLRAAPRAPYAPAELQEYRKAETADREMLKRLAVILSGSDAPGEIKALTVTAQSFVDRCKLLSKERDELRGESAK